MDLFEDIHDDFDALAVRGVLTERPVVLHQDGRDLVQIAGRVLAGGLACAQVRPRGRKVLPIPDTVSQELPAAFEFEAVVEIRRLILPSLVCTGPVAEILRLLACGLREQVVADADGHLPARATAWLPL